MTLPDVLAIFSFSKVEMITKLFLQICLHLFGKMVGLRKINMCLHVQVDKGTYVVKFNQISNVLYHFKVKFLECHCSRCILFNLAVETMRLQILFSSYFLTPCIIILFFAVLFIDYYDLFFFCLWVFFFGLFMLLGEFPNFNFAPTLS